MIDFRSQILDLAVAAESDNQPRLAESLYALAGQMDPNGSDASNFGLPRFHRETALGIAAQLRRERKAVPA